MDFRPHIPKLDQDERDPLIVPGKHHVGSLLVRNYYQQTGRLLTKGPIHAASLWITGGKKLVNIIIFHYVLCQKLCVHLQIQ